ncbi:MAG: serine/threonine-protein kinase [Myxococcaceae bacterium]
MPVSEISREVVSGEALFILKSLRENDRNGRSNKLADIKAHLEPSVTLEFDNYFFFLRKYHYIAMDREAQLSLTNEGEQVAEGNALDEFTDAVDSYFKGQITRADDVLSVSAELDLADVMHATSPADDNPFFPNEDTNSGAPPVSPRKNVHDTEGAGQNGASVAPSVAPVASRSSTASRLIERAERAAEKNDKAGGDKGVEIDSRYTRFEQMGVGPIGTVFRGRQNALGIDVAVKELKDIFSYFSFLQRSEVSKRLKKELCAQALVIHPAILRIYDQNTEVSRPYFITELMSGSVKARLEAAEGKALPARQVVRWFLQMAYGLRAAHGAGLFHHNLKPENVLLDACGNAKLSDFGLTRVIEVDPSRGLPQVFVGTGGMAYLAPELTSRTKDVNAAADVYGLGIMLYEMLTGQLPGRRSPLPSEVNAEAPSQLDTIFDKMTQDRRDARYPDMDAVLEAFYAAFSKNEYLARGDLILSSEREG